MLIALDQYEEIGCNLYNLFIGLRASMGAGYNRMNDLTVIQTTQV